MARAMQAKAKMARTTKTTALTISMALSILSTSSSASALILNSKLESAEARKAMLAIAEATVWTEKMMAKARATLGFSVMAATRPTMPVKEYTYGYLFT